MTSQNRAQMAIMIMQWHMWKDKRQYHGNVQYHSNEKEQQSPSLYNGNEENMSVLVSQNLAGYSFALSLASVSITVVGFC